MTTSNSDDFDNGFKFQNHNRNQHHKLPLHANFQPPFNLRFVTKNIGNFTFSLFSNDIIKFDKFCRLIQISIQ